MRKWEASATERALGSRNEVIRVNAEHCHGTRLTVVVGFIKHRDIMYEGEDEVQEGSKILI